MAAAPQLGQEGVSSGPESLELVERAEDRRIEARRIIHPLDVPRVAGAGGHAQPCRPFLFIQSSAHIRLDVTLRDESTLNARRRVLELPAAQQAAGADSSLGQQDGLGQWELAEQLDGTEADLTILAGPQSAAATEVDSLTGAQREGAVVSSLRPAAEAVVRTGLELEETSLGALEADGVQEAELWGEAFCEREAGAWPELPQAELRLNRHLVDAEAAQPPGSAPGEAAPQQRGRLLPGRHGLRVADAPLRAAGRDQSHERAEREAGLRREAHVRPVE